MKLAVLMCCTVLWAFAGGAAAQDSYPSRPVRIIVPYPPGNATDAAARVLATELTKALGQQFFVDNRGGAAGNIGMTAGEQATPDGYTLVVGTSATQAMNPHIYKAAANIGKNIDPVILMVKVPIVVSAAVGFPANSLGEMLSEAKRRPGGLSVAHPGTANHVLYEFLRQKSGAPLVGVPYKGSPEALTDVIGGQVPVIIDAVTTTRPQALAGKIKPLAISTLQASDLMPGVRTVAEQGFPGFELTAWNVLFAPKGTPRRLVLLLNARVGEILEKPEVRQRFSDAGLEAGRVGSPEALAEFLVSEHRKWGDLIKAANIPTQ